MPESCQQLRNCQNRLPEADRDKIFYHTELQGCFSRYLRAENAMDLSIVTAIFIAYLIFLVIGAAVGIWYDCKQTDLAAEGSSNVSAAEVSSNVSAMAAEVSPSANEQTGAVSFQYFRYITICLGLTALVALSVANVISINYGSEIELPNQCIHPVHTLTVGNECDEYHVAKNRTMDERNALMYATVFTLIVAGLLLFFALCSAVYVLYFTNTNATGWFAQPKGLARVLSGSTVLYLLILGGIYISLKDLSFALKPKFTTRNDHENCKSYDGFTLIKA